MMTRERRMGLTVLGIGVVLVLAIAAMVLAHERGSLSYDIVFRDAKGLQAGDGVQISGVDIGVVKAVQLQPPDRVLVRLKIRPKYAEQVRADSTALIRSVSFPNVSGQRVVEVINTERTPLAPPMADDTVVQGVNGEVELTFWKLQHTLSGASDDVAGVIGAVAENIKALGQSAREIAASPEVRQALADLKAFARTMKTQGQAAAAELNRQWPRLRDELQPILKNLEQFGKGVLAEQIRQTMAEIERTLQLWNDLQQQRPTTTPPPEAIFPSARYNKHRDWPLLRGFGVR